MIEAALHMCHTIKDNIMIAFYPERAHLYDESLVFKYKIKWDEVNKFFTRLDVFSIAPNHPDSKEIGFICAMKITGANIDDIPCKSVYDLKLAKINDFAGV